MLNKLTLSERVAVEGELVLKNVYIIAAKAGITVSAANATAIKNFGSPDGAFAINLARRNSNFGFTLIDTAALSLTAAAAAVIIYFEIHFAICRCPMARSVKDKGGHWGSWVKEI